MRQKKTRSMIIAAIMLLSIVAIIAPTIQASHPYSVKGILYLNENEIAEPGIEIKLVFRDGNETNTTYDLYDNTYGDNTNYNIGFFGHGGLTGSFIVVYKGHELLPEDNQTIDILPEQIGYLVDLHINTTGIDTEPPSKVTGLTVTDAKNGKLNLAWHVATDNVAVDHYNIYWGQDGYTTPVDTETTTTYQDTGLNNGQEYCYQISAVDTSDNEGEKSDKGCATPTETYTPPNPNPNPPNPNPNPTGSAPTANAGGPYIEYYIGEEITFNGSGSTGAITSYSWNFGDGATGAGISPTHAYTSNDNYTVILTVTGGGGTDIDTTYAQIDPLPNTPPGIPDVNGPQTGARNTEYSYTAQSYDPDFNATIQYTFVWGDGENATTEFYPNGTATDLQMHTWTTAGKYTIQVTANDNLTDSETQEYVVYIDTIDVANIGYMTNDDEDEPYDTFHGTDAETTVEKQTNGTYLIDNDGDGNWDYIYDPETDTLTEYTEGPIEYSDSMLQMLALGVLITIIFFLIIAYVLKKRK